jgi:photosystem II stability/assembly factor-like uncharacterized protein
MPGPRQPLIRSGMTFAAFVLCLTVSPPTFSDSYDLESEDQDKCAGTMCPETFAGLEMRSVGPALMSGRIADIALHPHDPGTWYVAAGSGNLWKTTNAGTTWTPLFEDQGSYSLGCVTIDPHDPSTIWLGTGENVGGRHVGYGDGVYRSRDGGASWENLGLKASEHIGTIIVHPDDPGVVYVACQGPLWSAGGERGLYKSTDGGASWNKILGGGEYTGVNEVRMDPRDPDVLYATTHQRFRNVAALVNGGPETAIHKSTDGGSTWRKLTKGLPKEDMGKIGLAISPQKPDVIYATIELGHRKGGFYRSTDGGASWEKRNDYISGGTGPHYYQEIFACPHQFDRVYQMDVRLHVTDDGGKTFRKLGHRTKHSDNHAMAFSPHDPDYLIVGCDGGIYESWDLGEHWRFAANLPLTQFYKVAVDYDEPFYNIIGGTQDNSTQHGPSRTDNIHGIRNSDWMITVFGDGHQPAIDPTNPDIIYSQWQEGNLVRHDRKTGEIIYIQPQPRADEPTERFNWDSPILISPHDPARLYFASQRIWRSDDRGGSWMPVSKDLTRNLDRLREPMMGRVWSVDAVWDLYAMSKFCTITSLAESPIIEGLLYAGTDDGLIQVSENGGRSWRVIDQLPGVADKFFVNDIKADLYDADTVYVCVDQHKTGYFAPYIFKSTDRGASWTSITGDLPDRHLVWRLVQDHVEPNLLFAGTEFGVFFSVDGGKAWIKLGGGAPNIPFRDLVIHQRENDLVGATFGRGIYVLDDYSALRDISAEALASDALLFSVRDAWWYVPRRTLGYGPKASQGDAFFVAPNPPFGAVFTYYLKDTIQTMKTRRSEKEKEIAKEGGDTPTPGWNTIIAESREQEPATMLTVRDADGAVVRHLTGPVEKGIHRVAWNLTYPSTDPWTKEPEEERREPTRDPDDGVMVAPGTYTVHLASRVDGTITDLGLSQSFTVKPMRAERTLPSTEPSEVIAFQREFAELRRQATGARSALAETDQRLKRIRGTLDRTRVDDVALFADLRAIERRIAELQQAFSGNEFRNMANEQGPVSIQARLEAIQMGTRFSLSGPTATHREVFELVNAQIREVSTSLNSLLTDELPALERRLDAINAPWTPGRPVPGIDAHP